MPLLAKGYSRSDHRLPSWQGPVVAVGQTPPQCDLFRGRRDQGRQPLPRGRRAVLPQLSALSLYRLSHARPPPMRFQRPSGPLRRPLVLSPPPPSPQRDSSTRPRPRLRVRLHTGPRGRKTPCRQNHLRPRSALTPRHAGVLRGLVHGLGVGWNFGRGLGRTDG